MIENPEVSATVDQIEDEIPDLYPTVKSQEQWLKKPP